MNRALESPRSLARLDLLTRRACSIREAAVASVLFVGLAFAVLGAHVGNGGFELDDWSWASDHQRYGGFFSNLWRMLRSSTSYGGSRPGEAVYFATTYSVFGTNVALHIALTIVLAGLMSAAAYVCMRTVGLERIHAAAIAFLLLVFPAADASRLWPSAGYGQLAICIYALGLLCSLHAFRLEGRASLRWHAAGVLLYGASLLTYEVAIGGVVASVAIYRLRVHWRPALRRWAVDLALLAPAALYAHHTKGASFGPGHVAHHIRQLVGQAKTLLTRLGVVSDPARVPLLAILLFVAAAAILAFRPGPASAPLRRWLAILGGGVIAVAAGYLPYATSSAFYVPLQPGIGNRTNIAAAFGYVLLLYALAVLAGYVLIAAVRRPAPGVALTGAAVAALAGLWIARLNDDRVAWDRVRTVTDGVLAQVRRAGKPAPDTTVYTFAAPGTTSPLVFTFSASWDLTGALQLMWHDTSLHGIPGPSLAPGFGNFVDPSLPGNVAGNAGLECRARDVRPRGWLYFDREASPYGKTIFVDVARQQAVQVRTRATCLAWASRPLS
jgi:hypothetical protein